MGHDHDHLPSEIRHEKPLWWALGLTSTFLLVEVVGAFWTNSLALLSDAAHMATDALALMIALVAVRLSRRPPDARLAATILRPPGAASSPLRPSWRECRAHPADRGRARPRSQRPAPSSPKR